MSTQHFAYMLKCADGSLYAGSTNNLEKRLHEHNNLKSGAHYTKIRRPVVLVYFELAPDFATARTREAEFKRWSRAEKKNFLEAHSAQKKQLPNLS